MNSGPDTSSVIYGTILVMLALSSLLARRLPWRQAFPMIGAWFVVFAILFAIFSFRGKIGYVWQQMTSDFSSEAASGPGGIVRIPRSDAGHYFAKAQVNGKDITMLIDTGATYTVFPEAMARDLGIPVDKSGFPTTSSTANGMVKDWRARADSLRVGSITRSDFPVRVTEGELDEALLGMNWLDTLKSWRVESGELVLEP